MVLGDDPPTSLLKKRSGGMKRMAAVCEDCARQLSDDEIEAYCRRLWQTLGKAEAEFPVAAVRKSVRSWRKYREKDSSQT